MKSNRFNLLDIFLVLILGFIGGGLVSLALFLKTMGLVEEKKEKKKNTYGTLQRRRYNFNDILFDKPEHANNILHALEDKIERDEYATVSDFYYLVGRKSSDPVDDKYGWGNLRDAFVIPTEKGYAINFPTPIFVE